MDNDNQDFASETETEPEENFEEMLNQSMIESVYLNPGEKIETIITTITKEFVFIDIGAKSEGYILLSELTDEEENITVNVGDTIEAYFLSSKNNEKMFTTRLSGDTSGSEHLEEAFRNQIPLEGLIEKENKGGFEVKLGGKIRAFCPFSQMELHRIKKTDKYIGEKFIFKIIEYGEKGRNIVVSHRVILEEERQKQMDALKEILEEGAIVTGKITSIKEFGAFVDIGGIEGLIPISEIAWGRVEDINEALSVGQQVDVAIKKLDWGNNKFSFSLKDILPDPWNDIDLKYPEGTTHKGKVARLARFGAFITLEPGIDGLLHISELGKGKRINHPRQVLEDGQELEVNIGKLDKKEKRLSLKLVSKETETNDTNYYKKHMSNNNASSGSLSTLGDLFKAQLEKKKG